MISTWKDCLLGDLLTLQRGFDLPARKREEGSVPIISSSGITGFHDEAKVEAPGVVTGRYGTLGEVFYIEQDFFPLNTTLYVRDFKGSNPRFISYLLQTLNLKPQNVAAAVPGLNRNDLHLLSVRKPPIATQRKIADILSGYDRLIENNTQRIKILEEMAQLLYREWFVNFRFPGHEKVSTIESELGLIPQGWKTEQISSFGKVITGKTPSKANPQYFGDYIPFIKTPSMHGNTFCIEVEEYLSELGAASQKGKTIPPNSLIVNCIGALAGSASITTTYSQTNQQINAVVLENQYNRELLYFTLVTLKETIRQHGSNRATMINLSKGKFETLSFICPTPEILSEFHELTSSQFDLIRNLQKQNINLSETRDLLLPKLISGEIDVEAIATADLEALEERLVA